MRFSIRAIDNMTSGRNGKVLEILPAIECDFWGRVAFYCGYQNENR